jgi:transglutaminase-like putative cysteine protease
VLDGYARGGFSASPGVLASARAFQGNLLAGRARAEPDAGDWTLYLEGGISPYIPLVGEFARLRFNSRMAFEEHEHTRVIRLKEVQANVLSIRLEAVTITAIQPMVESDLALVGKQPVWLDTSQAGYLAETAYPLTTLVLPDGEANREIIEAALTEAAITPEMGIGARVERIVEVLQQGRGYSLSVRIPDGDAETVLRWLDTPDAGHCELYAGAFILLARAAGIPASMVTGFAGGDWNGFENYFMVRNRHAHAWAEVFDPQRGWMTVDPTPATETGGAAATTATATSGFLADVSFSARLDSLRVLWYRRVIQFESADQEAMAASVRDAGSRLWMQLSGALRASAEWMRAVFSPETDTESDSTLSWRWLPWLAAGALAMLLIAACVAIRHLSRKRRMRSKAASLLRQARRSGIRVDLLTDEWAAGLLCICYGEANQWPSMPSQTIKQAKRALRQLGRTVTTTHASSPWLS